jgi:hypothetical protein
MVGRAVPAESIEKTCGRCPPYEVNAKMDLEGFLITFMGLTKLEEHVEYSPLAMPAGLTTCRNDFRRVEEGPSRNRFPIIIFRKGYDVGNIHQL